MVLALVDSLLGSMAYTFVAVFPQTSIYVMLAGGGLGSMMGGSMVIFLLAFSSVRDLNKDPSTYSFHLAITSSTVALGIVTGALTSGLLISRLSYARVFLTSQICMALAIFWAIFFLRETYRLHTDMDDFSINTISTPGEQKKPITWQSICNSIGVNKVFQTVFKLRPNRASLLIAMLTFQLVLFAEMGKGW